ncbi:hypothetical protein BSK54_05355 [Paenibacillus odorifer]|nr:hypothetical protein BSK54_05355 [Paenibacillus odorifer]
MKYGLYIAIISHLFPFMELKLIIFDLILLKLNGSALSDPFSVEKTQETTPLWCCLLDYITCWLNVRDFYRSFRNFQLDQRIVRDFYRSFGRSSRISTLYGISTVQFGTFSWINALYGIFTVHFGVSSRISALYGIFTVHFGVSSRISALYGIFTVHFGIPSMYKNIMLVSY